MGNLTSRATSIEGLKVIETNAYIDDRGAFRRFFCDEELASILGDRKVRQINHSFTRTQGAIRGMHFQYPPFGEMKLVRCLRGRIFDVSIDLRRQSQTFLQWFAIELSPEKAEMVVIPEGFAHGFQTLENDCELLYLHTQTYQPGNEGGIRFNDPRIGIKWPLPPQDLSDRDQRHSWIDDDFQGLN